MATSQICGETKMKVNAQEIIDSVYSFAKHYQSHDPMRWPYIAGCLETKIKEMARIINSDSDLIQAMKADLIRLQNELKVKV
jgi:hypothetical protein